jgi:hypothetical protein
MRRPLQRDVIRRTVTADNDHAALDGRVARRYDDQGAAQVVGQAVGDAPESERRHALLVRGADDHEIGAPVLGRRLESLLGGSLHRSNWNGGELMGDRPTPEVADGALVKFEGHIRRFLGAAPRVGGDDLEVATQQTCQLGRPRRCPFRSWPAGRSEDDVDRAHHGIDEGSSGDLSVESPVTTSAHAVAGLRR